MDGWWQGKEAAVGACSALNDRGEPERTFRPGFELPPSWE